MLKILLIAAAVSMLSCGVPARAGEALTVAAAALSRALGVERVELAMSARPAFRIFTLDGPPRVVVDLPPVDWRAAPPDAGGYWLVGGLRFGAREGGGRLVIDLRRPARVARAWTELRGDGARLILELDLQDARSFAALAGWPEGALPPPPPPHADKPEGALVMIDAGHGGGDPGAISRGVAEKDLVLGYARALAAEIAARPGLRAGLTREDDRYLTLQERLVKAREAGADLFLSLHADALAEGVATGAAVYVLSANASDRAAASLAKAHDRAAALFGENIEAAEPDVASALIDLARRRTDPRSRALAKALVARLRGVTPLLEGRAVQSAGFWVLRSPDVPSVLVELGFMSSATDRARLLSASGREALVRAVADGIEDWARAGKDPAFDALRAVKR